VSQENVETFRRNNEAVSRGDLEAALLDYDPEIAFIPRRAAVQGVYRGYEGMRRYFSDNAASFDFYLVSHDEFRDLGDRIVAFGTVHVRGKGSGVEVTTPTAIVATFREGKMVRVEDFGERAEALKAAGLEE
jgi:uncharacterized protein